MRGGEVEVGVAQSADIESRSDASVGAFRVDAGNAGGEGEHVIAAGEDRLQRVVGQGGGGERHVLQVFLAQVGGDDDDVDAAVRGHRLGRRRRSKQRDRGRCCHQARCCLCSDPFAAGQHASTPLS